MQRSEFIPALGVYLRTMLEEHPGGCPLPVHRCHMQCRIVVLVQGHHIGAELQKHPNNFRMSVCRRPFQCGPVILVPDFRIRPMFEEGTSNFGMTQSRCHTQRCLAVIKAPSVHVLRALDDQELYNFVYATICRIMQRGFPGLRRVFGSIESVPARLWVVYPEPDRKMVIVRVKEALHRIVDVWRYTLEPGMGCPMFCSIQGERKPFQVVLVDVFIDVQ